MKRVTAAGRLTGLIVVALALGAPRGASGIEYQDGRLQIHGFGEIQLRSMVRDYDFGDGLDLAQWYNVLNAEIEYDLAPDGLGPVDFLSAYARVEVRYDCVWTRACGLFPSADTFGNRANVLPGRLSDREVTDGEFVGAARLMEHSEQLLLEDHRIGTLRVSSLGSLEAAAADFSPGQRDLVFGRFDDFRFATSENDGFTDGVGGDILGPFLPKNFVRPLGALKGVPNPLRPGDVNPVFGTGGAGERPFRQAPRIAAGSSEALDVQQGLWLPDANLRRVADGLDGTAHDQNFREQELQWNRGAAQQDEKELKEAYLEMEFLEGALWGRVGKQTIVWGKTELFRNQDQFNPQDLALASLPSLEESRIGLWAARFIYSFYRVGPLSDVRLEAAVNFDQFEPSDVGDCGEPFTPNPVCGLKAQGLFAHGTTGLGLAGEDRPPDPWNDIEGLEGGLRLEFRYDRYTFAITDFWGFDDSTTAVKFNRFARNVDPATGRPRAIDRGEACVTGNEPACLQPGSSGPNNALDSHPANQTLFSLVCASTVGLVADPPLNDTQTCLTTLPNQPVLSPFLHGQLAGVAAPSVVFPPTPLVELNDAENAGAGGPLSSTLSPEQQALLGCGPFYDTDCDAPDGGLDLLNAEASVLFQSWLGFDGTPLRPAPGEVWTPAAQAAFLNDPNTPNPGTVGFDGGPVATRLVSPLDDRVFAQLPGARSPFDNPSWNASEDGCPAPGFPGCAGATPLTHPLSGQQFRSEMAALSWNFLMTSVAISQLGGDPEELCGPDRPLGCALVSGFLGLAGVQNPLVSSRDPRFGRRDFIWHGGGGTFVRFDKNNILGFSMDFAEDWSKTNWGIEFTWVNDVRASDRESFSGTTEVDEFNLTVSTDRPTIISFLNGNRSFFINQQTFVGFVKGFKNSFGVTGPIRVLQTLTIFTGYFQDRLNPGVTFVWEWETNSGAILASIDYRYTEKFRVIFGVNAFAGDVKRTPMPVNPSSLSNRVGENAFKRFTEPGISSVRSRDEIFLRLRYTF